MIVVRGAARLHRLWLRYNSDAMFRSQQSGVCGLFAVASAEHTKRAQMGFVSH